MKRKLGIALLVVLCTLGLAVLAARLYVHEGRGSVEAVDLRGKAFIEDIKGTKVVHLSGTPYEMGYGHGHLLKEDVRDVMGGLERGLDRLCRKSGVPRFVATYILDLLYKRTSPHIPQRYKRELEGLADGSGVSLERLRRAHVVSVLTERACSSFAVFGPATADGKLYHGRNFDWAMGLGLQDKAALFLYHPEGHIPFASPSYIGSIGCLSGMNREGISIAQIGAVSTDSRFDGIPLMFLLRRLLEECRNVTEAEALIRGARRTVGYNYVVADGKAREARAFETSAHHCATFRDDDPKEDQAEYAIRIKGAVFRSDGAIDQTVRRYQKCARGYPNMPYGSNSYDHRYKGMATRIQKNYGRIDANIALEILRATAMRRVNLHSVLCAGTDREMWVAHARGHADAWKQPYVHYDLKKLFGKLGRTAASKAATKAAFKAATRAAPKAAPRATPKATNPPSPSEIPR
jgi:hypothetical protein